MSSLGNSITPGSFESRINGYPKGVKIDVYSKFNPEVLLDAIEISYFDTVKGELCGTSTQSNTTETFFFSTGESGWRHIVADPLTEKPVFSKHAMYDLRLSAIQ